jgi:dGTPase
MAPYEKLLSPVRFRTSLVANRNIISEAESDRGRLLFCAAFRRLQQKAQVFSMEPNAAVRSRLTHSFEVSQIGRYIADQISFKLIENEWATIEQCSALVTFVETACLMHDIGNPPFGHFGEAAIREWFNQYGAKAIAISCGNGKPKHEIGTKDPRLENALADFLAFDGNPQGLRVVSKLQRNTDEHGLNLTKTTIGSYIKYVRSSVSSTCQLSSPFTKKCGYFTTESDIVNSVWQHFGYSEPQRFPLAYIMEAADDIAYCISDLEDSIEKGLLNQKTAITEILEQWSAKAFDANDEVATSIGITLQNAARGEYLDGSPFTYTDFRTALIRELARYVAEQYIKEHKKVLDGTLPTLMQHDSAAGTILELLKTYCRTKVYCHEVVQRVELAGYTAIYGLLEKFSCLLTCSRDRFDCALDYSINKDSADKPIIIEKKLLTLFPKNYIKVYTDGLNKISSDKDFSFKEWNLRAHLVTDFLAGMTDDFAMTTYRTLSGMRL